MEAGISKEVEKGYEEEAEVKSKPVESGTDIMDDFKKSFGDKDMASVPFFVCEAYAERMAEAHKEEVEGLHRIIKRLNFFLYALLGVLLFTIVAFFFGFFSLIITFILWI